MAQPKISPAKAGAGGLAAGVAMAVALISPFEGEVKHTYLDPVGIKTICYGHTGKDVVMGQVKTHQQCLDLESADVKAATAQMQACLKVPVMPMTAAGMISFGYNVGTPTFCAKIAPYANQGRLTVACDRMGLYVYAGHPPHKLPGLVDRRQAEVSYCLQGAQS